MVGEEQAGVGQRRRPKGTGSLQRLDRGRFRLRVFVGTDPVTGHPRQVTRTVQAKNQTEARTMLERLRAEVAAVEPSGSTATVRTLVQEWLAHAEARGRAPKTLHEARRPAETVVFPARLGRTTPRGVIDNRGATSTGEASCGSDSERWG
ncbi:MAG: hypothetical protein M0Z62_01850 [Actinomycetota bacterium]|nr:hypothetical protein [Actinomycetota bacterium]